MKTLIGVNTLTAVDQLVYLSHCNFWTKTVRQFPTDEFLFYAPHRMSIDNMRNGAVRAALANNCDYLMFIDDDVIVEPHTFKALYESKLDVCMALTYIRAYPYEPMFFKFDESKINLRRYIDYEKDVRDDGIVLCDAIGCSCVLFKTWMFKELKEPWFVTVHNKCTEDVFFCLRMHDEIKTPFTIGVNTKIPTAHKLAPEYVGPFNVKALREFHESLYPIKDDKGSNSSEDSNKSE